MLKKFKPQYLLRPLAGREAWLNRMSESGYRLKKVSLLHRYSFEPCRPGEYQYRVEFVADQSGRRLKDYQSYLSGLGIHSIPVSANLGKLSFGSAKLRWFGGNRFSLATSPGNINSEFLILEKQNDGKPFEIFSDSKGLLEYLKKCRGAGLSLVALFAFLAVLNGFKGSAATAIVCTVLCLPTLIFTIIWSRKIHAVKQEHQIHE